MAEAVVDTVVLRYFCFVGRQDLLLALLGSPLAVPRAVFDPDDGDVPEDAMSEVTRSILVQRRTANDPVRLPEARAQAARNAERLAAAHEMHGRGQLRVVDLDEGELELFGRLTSTDGARELGLRFPLGVGEAACVALAVARGWVLATDDQDALGALDALDPGHAYERIRRLLTRAASRGLIGRAEANALHAEMRRLGFRDHTAPFP
jgi:hypothetical protein